MTPLPPKPAVDLFSTPKPISPRAPLTLNRGAAGAGATLTPDRI